MELGKGQSLIAVALIALGVAAAESPSDAQQATSSMPSGVLTYLTYTARFASDGRFEIDGTIEGMGRFRFDGNWSRTGDRLDLRGSLDAAGAKLFAMTGMPPEAMMCPNTGTYRVGFNGADVTFDVESDACGPRRMVLDRTRWRPAGTAERPPTRDFVATAASPRPRIPTPSPDPRPWPSFRGREASGVADGQQLPDQWNVDSKQNVLWRPAIPGLAHSSPIVWGDSGCRRSAAASARRRSRPTASCICPMKTAK